MDKTAKEVIYKPKARNSIRKIAKHIAEKGYSETSKKLASKGRRIKTSFS